MSARVQNNRLQAIDALQDKLGYRFRDGRMLELALTHASVAEGARKMADNERLEFLGDRVLGLMIAEALMEAFPDATEGDLSRRFHVLVSRETCADVARALDLGAAIRLAAGETKSGGRSNPTILGDACEALMAAVYCDGGYDTVVRIFKPLWVQALKDSGNVSRSNPKSFLQEWAVAKGLGAPVYRLVNRRGPDHAPVFTIEVVIDDIPAQPATGKSRQEAEKAAALRFIERENLT
ncbi:ribonuclease III [Asticcacaulis sp. EMRT-3]|uniref:ribonuclease III n=1 Tax=Asticcacaulis sp. EMRT-3 TaxID=3040349 RepID=UPI0024AFF8F4|nr:ribonuclease III [Asticcacaulis sp. EMRT-3]MDI7774376.1 ribonuclease III [Asticcacaulis sp. EMRT-3]